MFNKKQPWEVYWPCKCEEEYERMRELNLTLEAEYKELYVNEDEQAFLQEIQRAIEADNNWKKEINKNDKR